MPEPGTWAMGLVGVTVVGALILRKRAQAAGVILAAFLATCGVAGANERFERIIDKSEQYREREITAIEQNLLPRGGMLRGTPCSRVPKWMDFKRNAPNNGKTYNHAHER